jgi:radical SAM superfamily enzyme
MVNLGWQPVGGHQVITTREVNRYSGQQHMDTMYHTEYTQTMVKDVLHISDEVVKVLNTLKTDAEMALSGEWDCTTSEGMESFNDQIELINKVLDNLK